MLHFKTRKGVKTILILFFSLSFYFSAFAQQPSWVEEAPGVWKTIIGHPDAFDLLTASQALPKLEGLKMLSADKFPLDSSLIVGEIINGQTHLRFPLEREEQLFGFGLNFKTVHQRGNILRLHVDHYGGRDNGRTHAPVPFYVSSLGYGVFVNAARYIDVYAGTGSRRDSPNAPEPRDRNTDDNWSARPYSDAVEMVIPTEGVEVYVFEGLTPLDAVRRYNLFTGGGPLPPRWGLGFSQRVPRLFSAEEVMEEVAEFEKRGFPLDVVGLEPGWQSKSYPNTFVWDPGRFSDPEGFIAALRDKGIRVNLWVNPYISPDSPLYEKLFPYTATHTVWAGIVPDFTISEARDTFWGFFEEEHVAKGVSGYKVDEVDGYDQWLWPDVAKFPSGISAEQMRQTYGLLVQKQSAAVFHRQNQRTFGLVRASNGGGTSFPYVLYNDYYDHQDFITALINSGYAGVLWTPEARASKNAEEWLRRIQTVVFSPMAMINAWASGTKPWSFAEVEEEVKAMAMLRMQMMPYWYSEFAKYHFEGTPPFRGMNLEAGFSFDNQKLTMSDSEADLETNPYAMAVKKEIKDQYMAGEHLLVAPMFEGEEERKVVLPEGKWYDFYSGELMGDGEEIIVRPGLSQIPVFVKDGGIIPMTTPSLHATGAGEKYDLIIRHYGKKEGSYRLYDDDGETFDYENGDYSWREIKVLLGDDGQYQGTVSEPQPGKPDNLGKITWEFMGR
ncbi:glycoside hydrolase family 31 protein [Pleomorphovibrio marinus]|uniref:glycoside hydrolase family 31 protein n=1 Tax=Pleomorphovibrio marinus TaxID=2164132 RepID=UPI000E0C609E|nr:TIM-barrel domain-containing protein [Pleomorphovibrio marinus]